MDVVTTHLLTYSRYFSKSLLLSAARRSVLSLSLSFSWFLRCALSILLTLSRIADRADTWPAAGKKKGNSHDVGSTPGLLLHRDESTFLMCQATTRQYHPFQRFFN